MNKRIKRFLNIDILGKTLIFLSILSFFCSDLSINIGFTLKPFHIIAAISLIYLILTRKNVENTRHISKVDKAFIVFLGLSLLSALLSPYSVMISLKHIVGIVLLVGSFYIFKKLYCRYDIKDVVKIASVAGIVIVSITILWYVIGLISLGFNFNIKDTFCFGVRVDRKIPRLISFAYNEPNYVSIYFSVLFSYYLCSKRSILNIVGLIGSFSIIVLTMSRGGYIAFIALMFIYLCFSKEKIKERILKTIIVLMTAVLSFTCITITMNRNDSKTHTQSAFVLMINRFSKSISDNGSNRLIHWQDAAETFKNHPVLGIGPGTIIEYNTKTYERESPSHNSYLDVFAEQGIIGGSFYLVLIIVIIVSCWKVRRFTAIPLLSSAFLIVSELFLSLAVTDMLLINVLIIDIVDYYWRRKKNYDVINRGELKNGEIMNANSDETAISFIVPVYNVEKYLEKCLNSLILQTAATYEVIIVDDGSTDDSPAICKKYAKKYSFIKYHRTKNGGLSAARNYGIQKAKGDYLWFVDSDDFIAKDSLSRIRPAFGHDIITVGYYNYHNNYDISEGNDNSNISDDVARYLTNPALAQLKIVKRSIFVNNKLQFAKNRNYEDIGLMYSLINYTKDIYHTGEKVYFYRRRKGSISTTFSEKNFSDHLWAIDQIGKEFGKGYDAEVEFQSLLQLLYSAFDIRYAEKKSQKDYFNQLGTHIRDNLHNYSKNKYITQKNKKNLFYRVYLSALFRGRYYVCSCLNNVRNVLIGDK